MENEEMDFVEVRAKAGRFKLIRGDIEKLAPNGTYRFVDERDPHRPMIWQGTRDDLERVFAKAMDTPSYKRGVFHQNPWPLADQFRVS